MSNSVSAGSNPSVFYTVAKRTLDVAFSLFALLVFFPLMALVAVLVKLDSRGPVFFRQRRVGKGGRVFEIVKFRSMVVNADKLGPSVTAADDHRMTRLGKALRATKIDELPQMFNVLVGDMSLVGPRPQVERYVELFPSEVKDLILSVAPGITGPTAIQFRHEESILDARPNREEFYIDVLLPIKCELDAEYVSTRSFSNDWRAFFTTVGIFARGVGHRFLRRPIGQQIELSKHHQLIIESYSPDHPQVAPLEHSRGKADGYAAVSAPVKAEV